MHNMKDREESKDEKKDVPKKPEPILPFIQMMNRLEMPLRNERKG